MRFLVRTFCATYNHENYTNDALKGFVIQQTDFPVVYTIIDDASTDKTPEVLRQFVEENFDLNNSGGYDKDTDYGHVTFAPHKTNKNCYFAVIYLKENHYSQKKSKAPYIKEWKDTKYIALCEGDDYWTDPLKLQKQVNYMETHEDCSCCAHNSLLLNTKSKQIGLFNKKLLLTKDYPLETFLSKGWFTPTQSLLFRRDNYQSFADLPPFMHGDYSLLVNVLLAPNSYLHYEDDIMSVYRDGGWASTNYGNKEKELCDDFIALFKYYKQKSNHRCDNLFDKLIDNQEKEKTYLVEYQNDLKKSRSPFVRVMHFICRQMAAVSNLYFDCLRVEKRVVKKGCPPLEELK